MSTDCCEVCGLPLGAHHLVLYRGVAHSAHRGPGGDERLCSAVDGSADYTAGRAHEAENVARGLKNIAGRLRNAGYPTGAARVRAYADRKAREAVAMWAQADRTRKLWRTP